VRTLAVVFAVIGIAGCDGGGKDEDTGAGTGDRAEAILALEGDPVAGEAVYTANCEVCHAAGGAGGSGPSLIGFAEPEELVNNVINGNATMPAFPDLLDQDIADVLAYVESL